MGEVIVTQFITVDGVVSDPDGRWGTDHGGWAFRYGLGPVSDDKFRLGSRMTEGCQLYGHRTWEHFARLWPGRDGAFADQMNAVPKFVVTRSGIEPSAWSNTAVVDGDLRDWVRRERRERDIVAIGSLSVVHQLAAADLVDEYRLVTFPATVGSGDRLFADGHAVDLELVSTGLNDSAGTTMLTVLRRPGPRGDVV